MALLLLLVAEGCRPQTVTHEESPFEGAPHVLLITVQGLRSDVVGAGDDGGSSLTPSLDALFASATVSGTAITPSPDTAPALASVLTGLSPWQHQAIYGDKPRPSRRLYSLAESFRDRGFSTTAALNGPLVRSNAGFTQGFEATFGYWRGGRIRRHLAELGEKPSFTWVHFDQPQPPFVLGRSGRRARGSRISFVEMEPYRNPATALPETARERFWQGYLRQVARLDGEVGELLEALRSSGRWEDSLVAFVSLHGEEFGELGQIGHGNNMGRTVLEVPWALKLPRSVEDRQLHMPERPPVGRIVSTLLRASGAQPMPALEPSFFEESSGGALSELYLGNGVNLFSYVEGDLQLIRSVRFARPERKYFLARRQLLGDPRAGGSVAEAEALFHRLRAAFDASRPFSAGPRVVGNQLFRWSAA
ncbi:MAG: sulfatase-like hydrolase/transferase, partial [Acidobacteria bacterium]|nr:sulfatase-like hydrolase/transferase [Acidobacteriota bacterium]